MSAILSLEEETLFNKTGALVLQRLRKTRNPADFLSVLRVAHKTFDRAYLAAPLAARNAVACRAGCDACCHVPVGVQAHEVLLAAEFIQTHFSPEDLESAIGRAVAHRDSFSGLSSQAQAVLNLPCALLRDGRCTIYDARPEACRSHHSPNADTCRANLDPAHEEIDVAIPGLRSRMFAVMLAIDQAVAEAGFDGQAYDFGSALHEALTDSRCAVRWMQRQPAFSAACHEAPISANEDSGVMRAEGYFQ